MLRKKIGISGLRRSEVTQGFKKVGHSLQEEEAERLKEQLAAFKELLSSFATKHKSKISRNPEFRAYFNEMCATIGVDPLASGKGFWVQLLGMGDFYYKVAVQVIEVCIKTRDLNGGLLPFPALLSEVQQSWPQSGVCASDIETAVKKIKLLGNSFQVVTIGSKKFVQSVPCELSPDHVILLDELQESRSCSAATISMKLNWQPSRAEFAFNFLLSHGFVWLDTQDLRGAVYWLPEAFSLDVKWECLAD